MLLTLTLLLSCAMVTSATDSDPMLDLVASMSVQEEFLIYDIRGVGLSEDDVLAAFSGFNVPYKFKSLSGCRFLVVVMKDNTDHTRYSGLSFPAASQVDVYPAEHLGDFSEYAGADNLQDKSVIALSDEDLILTEITILDTGADVATFKQHVAASGQEYEKHNNEGKVRGFHITATFPAKLLIFQSFPAYATDRLILEGDAVYVGPFQTEVVTTPIVNM